MVFVIKCVVNVFSYNQFIGFCNHLSSVYIFSTNWLCDVYIFNRTAIGCWLLAFGFLANSQ